jgi:hypothetical protein
VARYPANGTGLDCDPALDTCGVPREAPLELRFDRFLDPTTAVRQSIQVFTRYPDVRVFLEVGYDVVERVVSYRPFNGRWAPDTLYTVLVPSPASDGDNGFRAFDGAPIEATTDAGAAFFVFRTTRATGDPTPEPTVSSCAEILGLFEASGCTASSCHGGSEPAAGLDLTSGSSLARTALRRVARETETGVEVDHPLVDPARFGTQMALIQPGSAPTSYLMYKLLAKPENYAGDCTTAYQAPPRSPCPTPSAAELERLRSGFVQLDPMPPGDRSLGSLDALRAIARYIDAGASVDDCNN